MGISTDAAFNGMRVIGMELTCCELLAFGDFKHIFEDRFQCPGLQFLQDVPDQAKLYFWGRL
jgi:hypothetical protein